MARMELPSDVYRAVLHALEEDRADHDVTTSAVVPNATRAQGRIVARAAGVLSGCDYATAAFQACDSRVRLEWTAREGDRLEPDQEVLRCSGIAHGLLAAERTALNFLQQLSGVATATAGLVDALGAPVQVLDTRKTVPGLRHGQKRAVVSGGGVNHRRDLSDQLLLKENHFALSGRDYAATVRVAKEAADGRVVGAEAQDEAEAALALEAGADYVLLDNFSAELLPGVVERLRAVHPHAVLEVSGGIRPDTAPALRGSGVDRVSVGWLTHTAPALDLSFYLEHAG